jgi:hypothetical protein
MFDTKSTNLQYLLKKNLGFRSYLDFLTKMQPNTWKLSRILQNTQYLEKIERLNSNSQKSTQNLEELGFSDLPQTNR